MNKFNCYTFIFISVLICLNLIQNTYASDCATHFYQGNSPVIPEQMKNKIKYVCYSGFAVLHSGVTKTPLFSAERLTRIRIEQAKKLERVDSFYPEPSVPSGQRAELRDYLRSGYDRGHLAPNKDMSDAIMQHESFSLANIVPQDPNNNRGIWENIESATRRLIEKSGEGYVVSGPAYLGNKIIRIGNNVFVPTHLWKAIYIPSSRMAGVYWVNNVPGTFYEIISIAELYRRTGIDPFPTLSTYEKINVGSLNTPIANRYR